MRCTTAVLILFLSACGGGEDRSRGKKGRGDKYGQKGHQTIDRRVLVEAQAAALGSRPALACHVGYNVGYIAAAPRSPSGGRPPLTVP